MFYDSEYNELKKGDTVRFSYPEQNGGYLIAKGTIRVLTDLWSTVEYNNKRYTVKTNSLIKVES